MGVICYSKNKDDLQELLEFLRTLADLEVPVEKEKDNYINNISVRESLKPPPSPNKII